MPGFSERETGVRRGRVRGGLVAASLVVALAGVAGSASAVPSVPQLQQRVKLQQRAIRERNREIITLRTTIEAAWTAAGFSVYDRPGTYWGGVATDRRF
jgi:hypothetical protein